MEQQNKKRQGISDKRKENHKQEIRSKPYATDEMRHQSSLPSSVSQILSIEQFHWESSAAERIPYRIEATQGRNEMKRDRS